MLRASRVFVVAAPSCGGKTYLIERLNSGECADICETLGIGDPSAWTVMLALMVERSAQAVVPRLLLHYDLYAQRLPAAGFRLLPGLIGSAASVKILTLQVTSATLVRRNRTRVAELEAAQAAGGAPNPVSPARLQFAKDRQQAYEAGGFVQDLYRQWYGFTDRCGIRDHWVMDLAASNDSIVRPVRRNLPQERG